MLGLAFFKTLVKNHGLKFFEPIGKALQRNQMRTLNPLNPLHLWALRAELKAYTGWALRQKLAGKKRVKLPAMDPRLARHAAFALDQLRHFPLEISGTMRKHQLKLADRQCRMAELSQRVQDTVTILVTALWARQQSEEATLLAADLLCQDLQRKLLGGRHPSDHYFRDAGRLADLIIGGGFEAIAGAPRAEILMKYENR
jgi:hypothetical protein